MGENKAGGKQQSCKGQAASKKKKNIKKRGTIGKDRWLNLKEKNY